MIPLRPKLNLRIFKMLPTLSSGSATSGQYTDLRGRYCSQGKIGVACGFPPEKNIDDFKQLLGWLGVRLDKTKPPTLQSTRWDTVILLNDTGKHVEADALALELAVASGNIELVGGIKDRDIIRRRNRLSKQIPPTR